MTILDFAINITLLKSHISINGKDMYSRKGLNKITQKDVPLLTLKLGQSHTNIKTDIYLATTM